MEDLIHHLSLLNDLLVEYTVAWFNEEPVIYDQEIKSLIDKGFEYEIDEAAYSSGRLVINVYYILESTKHTLKCSYPSSFPYFPPKVNCSTLPAGRHIDPYFGGVCLFENEQSVWNPSDTLGKVLSEQIPKLIQEHKNNHDSSQIEGLDGYQVSGQIPYERNSVIFADNLEIPENITSGHFQLRYSSDLLPIVSLTGYVKSLSYNGYTDDLSKPFLEESYDSEILCRWVKIESAPSSVIDDQVLIEAVKINPDINKFLLPNRNIDIIGLVFKEESNKSNEVQNWIFVIRRKRNLTKAQKKSGVKPYRTAIVRSDRFSLENIQKRIPRLKDIVSKKVLVIGAGALGSQVIWQLARSGVQSLTIIDRDFVQAGNVPRWLLGFSSIGKPKVEAIATFLKQNYPQIFCKALTLYIGYPDHNTTDTHELLLEYIKSSDLIIDCSAEINITHYISDFSKKFNKPFIWATATQGGWGGIVGRIIPSVTKGNWIDFNHLNSNGDIPDPAAEEGSDIQPVGCFHPTFTGTGFDLDHVSLMATRLAISTLCRDIDGGYPDFDWDVCVLNLWDELTGLPIAPQWSPHTLKKYSGD